jgi:hypothetical protein
MTTHTPVSDHPVPWCVLMLTPSGHVEMVEVRASSAALALATARDWKPCHRVATDPRGAPLVYRVGGPRSTPPFAPLSGPGVDPIPARLAGDRWSGGARLKAHQ